MSDMALRGSLLGGEWVWRSSFRVEQAITLARYVGCAEGAKLVVGR